MWAALFSFLATVARLVIQYIKGPSAAPTDPDRVRKLEEALARERDADLREFDAKANAARDRAAADRLLRDVTDDPTVN